MAHSSALQEESSAVTILRLHQDELHCLACRREKKNIAQCRRGTPAKITEKVLFNHIVTMLLDDGETNYGLSCLQRLFSQFFFNFIRVFTSLVRMITETILSVVKTIPDVRLHPMFAIVSIIDTSRGLDVSAGSVLSAIRLVDLHATAVSDGRNL